MSPPHLSPQTNGTPTARLFFFFFFAEYKRSLVLVSTRGGSYPFWGFAFPFFFWFHSSVFPSSFSLLLAISVALVRHTDTPPYLPSTLVRLCPFLLFFISAPSLLNSLKPPLAKKREWNGSRVDTEANDLPLFFFFFFFLLFVVIFRWGFLPRFFISFFLVIQRTNDCFLLLFGFFPIKRYRHIRVACCLGEGGGGRGSFEVMLRQPM